MPLNLRASPRHGSLDRRRLPRIAVAELAIAVGDGTTTYLTGTGQ